MAYSFSGPQGDSNSDDMKEMTEREISIMDQVLYGGSIDLYNKVNKKVCTYLGWESDGKGVIYLKRLENFDKEKACIMWDNIDNVIEEKPKNLWELFDDIVKVEDVPYDPLVEKILCLLSDYKDEISSFTDKHFGEDK